MTVLLAFYVGLLASLREKSATFDEPGHATAGYLYWEIGDYGLDPENGNELWRAYMIPAPGEPGSETWPKGGPQRLSEQSGLLLGKLLGCE